MNILKYDILSLLSIPIPTASIILHHPSFKNKTQAYMKLILYIVLVILLSFQTTAQNVAINNDGTAPAAGAMLDIKSLNKGLLIPRIALTGSNDVTTIPTRPVSLLIYNTATIAGGNAVTPGYYYWNGTSWTRLITSDQVGLSGWTLTGNSGTNPAQHFIGTVDNANLQFRVNNTRAGLLASNGNIFWGLNSGLNTSGLLNIGIGTDALYFNTTGDANVAVGYRTLYRNTTGGSNVAMGEEALWNNTNGFNNTAIGDRALWSNTTAFTNTAVGSAAMINTTTGHSNSALGEGTLEHNISGSSNTAVGYKAMQT